MFFAQKIGLTWVAIYLLVSSLLRFDVTIVARIPFGELIAFASIPFVLRGQHIAPYRNKIIFVTVLIFVWGLGICISDFVNQNHFELFIRAAMKPVFCYLWFLFFLGLILRDYRILLFGVFGSIISSLQNYILPQAYTVEYLESGGYEATAFGLAPILFSICSLYGIWMYGKHRLNASFAYLAAAWWQY